MSEKIIGYTLLVLGLIVIFYSTFSVYQVFTKQSKPVQLFNFKGISIDPSSLMEGSIQLPPELAQFAPQKPTTPPQQEIIPAALINDSSNVFAHLILMGFVMSMGAKIASLGIQLVRPIVVKLKAKEVTT